jgi:hypothetical protein
VAPQVDIAELDGARVAAEAYAWPFAQSRRDEIAAHFAARVRERPGMWNGRVLLMRPYAIAGRTLTARCFETDYASFDAWRLWGFPDPSVYNFFAAAALRGADGGYVLGEMAPYTANAGSLYFPCGTPEPADIGADGTVDFDGHLGRELAEETGIDIGELSAEPGWTMVRDGCYLGFLKQLTARESAGGLRERILRHCAAEKEPELTGVRIVRGPADLDSRMPPFVVGFLQKVWRR